jgi:hypothetical protein
MALVISWLLWPAPSQGQDEATVEAEVLEASPQDEDAATAEAEVPEESPEERAARRREEDRARILRSIWWNRAEMVTALSLSDAARSKMDDLYTAYLEEHGQGGASGDQRAAFLRALAEGDWAQARKHLDEMTAESGVLIKAQGELKIGVLSLLSDEQHAKLVDENIDVLRRPWVQGRRQGAGRPRVGRRQGRR